MRPRHPSETFSVWPRLDGSISSAIHVGIWISTTCSLPQNQCSLPQSRGCFHQRSLGQLRVSIYSLVCTNLVCDTTIPWVGEGPRCQLNTVGCELHQHRSEEEDPPVGKSNPSTQVWEIIFHLQLAVSHQPRSAGEGIISAGERRSYGLVVMGWDEKMQAVY